MVSRVSNVGRKRRETGNQRERFGARANYVSSGSAKLARLDKVGTLKMAEIEGITFAEAMILNVPPAFGPHYCSSASLAP